jgi:hypothetical protein
MRSARVVGLLVCLFVVAPGAVAAGGGWSFQSYPNGARAGGGAGQLTAVSCTSTTTCTAVGNGTLPYRWDGSRWRVQSTPSADGAYWLLGVSCPRVSDCTAVGISHHSGSRQPFQQPLAEHWDGSKWMIERTPRLPGDAELRAVSCSSPRACIAVGEYATSRTDRDWSLVERWDGNKWKLQHIPKPGNAGRQLALNAVSCSSAGACTAVGSTGGGYPSNGSQEHVLALRWNGQRWSVQRTAGPGQGALTGVSCPSGRSCIAVGYRSMGKSPMPLAEHWNGKAWTLQHTARGVEPYAVSCASTHACTAVGQSKPATGGAERWNGRQWSSQSMPYTTEEYSLDGVSCPSVSYCAAGGQTLEGSYPFPVIERWTG